MNRPEEIARYKTHETDKTYKTPAVDLPRWHVHKRLYHWALHWAETRYGGAAMAVLAFSEAIFFPVPADVLLIALCLGRPKRSFFFGLICVSFSILGGCVAFGLGLAIGGDMVKQMFDVVHLGHKAEQAMSFYRTYDFWAVAVAALTPVPYMVFSWLGGISQISFAGFVLASVIFRSLRFFSEAGIIYFAGPRARSWIEKYFNLASILAIVLVLVLVLALRAVSKLFPAG